MYSRRRAISLGISSALVAGTPLFAENISEAEYFDDYSRGEIFKIFLEDPYRAELDKSERTLAIPKNFTFARDALFDCSVVKGTECSTNTSLPRPKNMIFGIDISHHTGKDFGFNELRRRSIRFVQMKTSQGLTSKDKKFSSYWKSAGKLVGEARVYRGPYHFLTAQGHGNLQAEHFLTTFEAAARATGEAHRGFRSDDMSPGVDLEWDVYPSTGKLDHWAGKGEQFILDTALGCLEKIESETGRVPIIYTGKSWFGSKTISLDKFHKFSKYPLWVFDYDPIRKIAERPSLPMPEIKPALWQFTSSARAPEVYKHDLDASVFYGSEAEFKKTFGIAV